jgi:hypothetical protein
MCWSGCQGSFLEGQHFLRISEYGCVMLLYVIVDDTQGVCGTLLTATFSFSVVLIIRCCRAAGEMDSVMVQLRQGVEAQQRNPLHAYHSRVRLTNYDCYFFEPITLQELDKVSYSWVVGGGEACVCCVPGGGSKGWGQVSVCFREGGGGRTATPLSPSHCRSWIR